MNSVLETSVTDCHPASVPDYSPIPELRDLQLQRLQSVVTRAWRQVKLFHSRMDERGLAPEDIRSLEDIAKLPFTEKGDLRDTYPLCVSTLRAEPQASPSSLRIRRRM